MRRYRHSAVLVAGMLLVLPSLSSAQDTDPIPGLDLPSFDVPLPDIPDTPDIDVAPPEIEDFSLTLDGPIFDVDVVVQFAPGDPIPDVDVTLRPCCRRPPPDDECSEDGCD